MDYAILTERLGKIGARRYDDYATLVATWIDGNEPIPTEAEYAAEDAALRADIQAETVAAATRAANKTKAQAFLTAVSSVRSEIATFKTQATTLSGRTYSGATAAQLAAIQADMRAIGTRLAALMGVLDKVVDGEVFLGGEILR